LGVSPAQQVSCSGRANRVIAIVFALFLPKGLWSALTDRLHLQLLPVGYRLERGKDKADRAVKEG
jgi:hypothetical protein